MPSSSLAPSAANCSDVRLRATLHHHQRDHRGADGDRALESGEPITEGLIREIHKRLVEGVRGGAGGPGVYRTVQNYVANSATREIVYTPPSPVDVPPLMSQLVAWLNTASDVHPVLQSGLAQFQFVNVHPFVDGNGRTSRLLSTLCLYRAGYDFKRLFTISEFYDRDMDLTGWLEFFVDGLATQLEEVQARGPQRSVRT